MSTALGDVVNEFAGEGGLDRVVASVSYVLTANANVELLETATQSGTTQINLVGSSIGNTINGNDGAATFQFGTALGPTNIDTIVGFVTGADRIALDDAIFTAIGPVGALNAGAFFIGSAAHEADDRIIYNSATGAMLYDADGDLAGAAVQFATLSGAPALAAGDFLVI